MSEERKICPLRPERVTTPNYSSEQGGSREIVDDFGYCVKDDCAWYVSDEMGCAVVAIGWVLNDIGNTLRR